MRVARLRLAVAWAAVMCVVLVAQTWTRAQRPGGIDLTSYLLSADVLRGGGSPYLLPTPFPYLYPATLAFLLIPLTFVPALLSLLFWFALNAGAAVWSIRALVRTDDTKVCDSSDTAVFLAVFFTVFFSVVQSNLRNGQVNFLVLLLCVLAATRQLFSTGAIADASRQTARHGRGRLLAFFDPQAISWALAIALKLVPLVLVPYFLLRRNWLWLLTSVALIAFWCLLPAVVVGRKIVDFYQQFWSVLSATSMAATTQPLDFSLAGTLAWITGTPLTPVLKASAAAVVIGWIMPVDARRLRALTAAGQPATGERPPDLADKCAFALYLLAIPLLSPQSEIHHLAFMLPAAAIVAASLWRNWRRTTTALRVSALAAAALYLLATATRAFSGPLFCAALITIGVAVVTLSRARQP